MKVGFLPKVWLGVVFLTALHSTFVRDVLGDELPIPSFTAFKQGWQPSDVLVLDRYGQVLASKRVDATVRRLAWVGMDEVSPAFVRALLQAEDRRFFDHAGVDWWALGSALGREVMNALWRSVRIEDKPLGKETLEAKSQGERASKGVPRGASSISMQVASFLDPALQRPRSGRDGKQKWQQIEAALALERVWSKAEILEAYFNTVFFRGELQGLAAASWGLFNKSPSGLDRYESALLAALIRGPNARPTLVAQRACEVLDEAVCDKTRFQQWLFAAEHNPQPYEALAPHAAQQVVALGRAQDGSAIQSTLDASLQQVATEALHEQLGSLRTERVRDGAVVVLDNKTGAVLAYVGSSGVQSNSPAVDVAQAPRQVGSALKPLLYALAFDRGLLTPATLLDDRPMSLPTAAGLYTPQNYDRQFIGAVSVRKALASSLNIPAVQTITLTGVAAFHQRLQRLGFKGLHPDAEHYGYALALGAVDVRLIDLTNAYRTLANGGSMSAVRWHWESSASVQGKTLVARKPTGASASGRRIFSAESAWQIAHILSDNRARAHTFGWDSVLATPFWTAVKTGTSKDMRDNWCVGFSQYYTVGVWVGNAEGEPMQQVSGVTGAAPVWAQVMNHLHRSSTGLGGVNLPSKMPPAPQSLVAQKVRFENHLEPGRVEWLRRAADGPLLVRLSEAAGRARITYPLDHSVVAWDPDIPVNMQGIVPKHSEEGAVSTLRWVFNGQVQAEPAPVLHFQAGTNTLVLQSDDGQELDRVQFAVRGYPSLPQPTSESQVLIPAMERSETNWDVPEKVE